MMDERVAHALRQCYQIAEAGEKGYATAAVNMPNLGIKILLKSLAEQRARFKAEITELLGQMGVNNGPPGRSLLAVIHRGRVTIFAAMTIEDENKERVILKEVLVGEGAAVRTYSHALARELPAPVSGVLERHLTQVREAHEMIRLMLGHAGNRMVVRLFQSDEDAQQAVQSLHAAGFTATVSEKLALEKASLYNGKGATVIETILSGAVGGALWGGVTGILVGIGVVQTANPGVSGFLPVFAQWLLVALGFLAIGAFISSVLAFFIGVGISEDDTVQLRESLDRYHILLQTVVDQAHFSHIRQMIALEHPKSI